MSQRTYTHDQAAALLRSIPIGSFAYLLGRVFVRRVSRHEWQIENEPARKLLTAIDRLMGPADRPSGTEVCYRFPRSRRMEEVCP